MCLVGCKIMCVCVFRDVEQHGLSRQLCLAESDQCDAVLCALVVDLDFDGQHELLLGTYGQVECWIQNTETHARDQKYATMKAFITLVVI